jgi:hypothetical protein
MHARKEETQGNCFDGVEHVRAERCAAPIVGNESRLVSAGVSRAAKGQGLRAKPGAWFLGSYVWDLYAQNGMGPATTKTPNTGMRIWKKIAGDILGGTASSRECIQYYIGFAQNTMILPRARLRIARVLSRRSYSPKKEQG